jgi:hypothetical protein
VLQLPRIINTDMGSFEFDDDAQDEEISESLTFLSDQVNARFEGTNLTPEFDKVFEGTNFGKNPQKFLGPLAPPKGTVADFGKLNPRIPFGKFAGEEVGGFFLPDSGRVAFTGASRSPQTAVHELVHYGRSNASSIHDILENDEDRQIWADLVASGMTNILPDQHGRDQLLSVKKVEGDVDKQEEMFAALMGLEGQLGEGRTLKDIPIIWDGIFGQDEEKYRVYQKIADNPEVGVTFNTSVELGKDMLFQLVAAGTKEPEQQVDGP